MIIAITLVVVNVQIIAAEEVAVEVVAAIPVALWERH